MLWFAFIPGLLPNKVAAFSEHAEQVINQFENLGSKVIQRKGMHQKIAIIDGKIAWEGSLNITKSQRHQGADAPF